MSKTSNVRTIEFTPSGIFTMSVYKDDPGEGKRTQDIVDLVGPIYHQLLSYDPFAEIVITMDVGVKDESLHHS